MAGQAGTGRARSAWERSLAGPRRCGSQWGLTDLYPDFEERLRGALESAAPFWLMWRAGKVRRCATVERKAERGPISVVVREFAEDAALLTDSIIWSAFGGNAYAGSGRAALRKAGFGELTWDSVSSLLKAQGLFAPENAASVEAVLFCETSWAELLDEVADCEHRVESAQEARYQSAVRAAGTEIRRWYAMAGSGCAREREAVELFRQYGRDAAARAALFDARRAARQPDCRAQSAS
jgi:hypothetical protein